MVVAPEMISPSARTGSCLGFDKRQSEATIVGLRFSGVHCGALIALAMVLAGCDGSSSPSTSSTLLQTSPTLSPATVAPTVTQPHSTSELVNQYFATEEPGVRLEVADAIAGLISVDQLPSLLHTSVDFPHTEPGRKNIASPIGFNQNREIVVRTPQGYDPSRPWPLIVAYHGWGGEADVILDRMENILGSEIENYVVAAPDDYRQTVIDAPPPVSSEHVSVWRTLRQRWHIDADRTYLAGYSLGGDTVLTLASMHPSQIAGGLAMAAGAAYPTDVAGLPERFLAQLAPIEMLHVYGEDDTLNIVGLNARPQEITLAQQGELVDDLTQELGLTRYRVLRLTGVGHSGVFPTTEQALVPLSATRIPLPTQFSHSFRYIHQADAFWIEGHEWLGDAWLTAWPDVEPDVGETDEEALVRTIHSLLGRIDASIDNQTITVDTEHLSDFTVWLEDDMIDWSRPIVVVANGGVVFDGEVAPSIEIALAQAHRTYDFDRLRLAGIRIDVSTGTAHIVTPTESFPDIVRGITY
jgi:dienelactone hydrolase